MSEPLISIVIAARNAEKTISKCLMSLEKLNYPAFEVIVVDDGSTDRTASITAGFQGIKLLHTDGIGPSAARNMAVKEARGEFIAFTDADCIVDIAWLTELMKGFTSEKVAGVGGAQQSPEDETPFGKKVHLFFSKCGFFTNYMQSGSEIREVAHSPSCNVIYRKIVYEKFGGFLEGFWPGEDLELDHRLVQRGYELVNNSAALVCHYRTQTLEGFKRMMFRYGWAQGKLVRMHGFFRFIQWLPLLTLTGFLAFFFYPVPVFCLIALAIAGVFLRLSCDAELWVLAMHAFLQWHVGFLRSIFHGKGPCL